VQTFRKRRAGLSAIAGLSCLLFICSSFFLFLRTALGLYFATTVFRPRRSTVQRCVFVTDGIAFSAPHVVSCSLLFQVGYVPHLGHAADAGARAAANVARSIGSSCLQFTAPFRGRPTTAAR